MKRQIKLFPFLYCFLISLICLIPYISKTSNLLESDILYHISRIDGLSESIYSNFNFFPKIYSNLFDGKGYAFPMFYCDLFLIPAAIISKFTGVIIAYKFEILLINFFTAYFAGRTLKRIGMNDKTTLLGVVLYVFSYYRLYNIYYRAALGELLATMFIPIALLGIYNSIFNNEETKLINMNLIIGFGGVALSHNISLFLLCLLYFIFILLNIKKVNYKQVLISTIITILLSLWFFYPMIEQLAYNDLVIENVKNNNFIESFYSLKNLLFITGNQSFLSARCGDFTIIISILLFIRQKIKKIPTSTFQNQLFYVGIIFLLLSTKLAYPIMSIFSVIQFASRFFLISSTVLSIYITMSCNQIFSKINVERFIHKLMIVSYSVFIIYFIIFLFTDSLLVCLKIQSRGIYNDYKTTTAEIFSETSLMNKCFSNVVCLDSGIDDLYLPNNIKNITNNNFNINKYANINRNGDIYTFQFFKDYNGYAKLPIVYYYGYQANIDGNPLSIYIGENGYIKAYIDVNKGELLTVQYKNSINSLICYCISAVTLILLIIKKSTLKLPTNKKIRNWNER